MTADEIRETWEYLYGRDAFEVFDHQQVDNATIKQVLGQEVACDYSSWIYFYLK